MSDSIVGMYENKIEALKKELAEAQAEIEKIMDAAQKMLDIAPEYNNGCGCCSSLSMEQTDEYKALSAIVAENKAAL